MRPRRKNCLRSQDFHKPIASNLRQGGGGAAGRTRLAAVCGRFPPVKRTAAALVSTLVAMLVVAPAAMAENGVGLAGPTTDKTVTFFCFGVIAFFAILPIVMSLIQGKLEKRKDRRRSDLERFN
jgi:putative copper export protein